MKILLCDTNLVILKLLERTLIKSGYEVYIARDGIQAIEIIKEQDLNFFMTELLVTFHSGLELLQYARQKNNRIFMVILSEVNSSNYIQQAFKIGALDYITKPFDPDVIPIHLKKILLNQS
jgi:two-component system, OmpR family, response regulator VicR